MFQVEFFLLISDPTAQTDLFRMLLGRSLSLFSVDVADRESGVLGKSVDLGGRRVIKKKKKRKREKQIKKKINSAIVTHETRYTVYYKTTNTATQMSIAQLIRLQ